MSASPPSAATGPSPSGSRIGRPPQWTVSRSRKLARLYLYSTLSIERIIQVLEDDGFKPRKNSAQKTIHKMLDNDPRYLRPESRIEMSKRINNLCKSPTRRRRKRVSMPRQSRGSEARSLERENSFPVTELFATPTSSIKGEDTPAFDFCASPETLPGVSRFPAPFRGYRQQSADTPGSSDDYSATIHDMKRRISDCSSHYAFQIETLVKEFTISIASDDDRSVGRRPSAAMSEISDSGDPFEFERPSEAYEAFPEPGFALPGDFLSAHTRSCADFPGQQHGKGSCWCSIAKETSAEENSWLLPTGQLSERARCVLENLSQANLNLCDSFGNTPLHLCAALEGYREILLRMVLNCENRILRALNTAGQTFLHVLNLEWFSDFASLSTPLKQLLGHIRGSCPELVYANDVYGRNFFHRAHSLVRDTVALTALVSPFNPTLASRRDAFGFIPIPNTESDDKAPYVPPRRTGLSPQVKDLARFNTAGRKSSTDEGSLLAYHARLVQVIQSSYNNPGVEDAEGRNGLHCLAEAIINQQSMDRHVQGVQRGVSSNRPHLKRKLDPNDAAASNRSSPSPGATTSARPSPPLTTPPATTTTTTAEATLLTRLRHLQSLLHPSIGIPTTHYDRRGMTPLMAFVEHIPDDHDDKAKTLQGLLETLVRAGAADNTGNMGVNMVLEARNYRGETALLIAARLGRKVAISTLLEMGANVHVRDVHGRGVLEVLDREVGGSGARGDVALYARLEACRVLLTGRREWGLGCQSDGLGGRGRGIVREWALRRG